MSIAKVIEITARSPEGFDQATAAGIAHAAKSVKNIQHAWVKDQEVRVTDGKITEYCVSLKITFVVNA